MSNFWEVHSRFSAVMKRRINSMAAQLFFLKLGVAGPLTHWATLWEVNPHQIPVSGNEVGKRMADVCTPRH